VSWREHGWREHVRVIALLLNGVLVVFLIGPKGWFYPMGFGLPLILAPLGAIVALASTVAAERDCGSRSTGREESDLPIGEPAFFHFSGPPLLRFNHPARSAVSVPSGSASSVRSVRIQR